MNKHCKHCKEPLPPFALHFSNTIAIDKGYCSYFCMLSALGEEKALKVLQKYHKKPPERSQEGRSQAEDTAGHDREGQDMAIYRGRDKKSVLELILCDDPQGDEG